MFNPSIVRSNEAMWIRASLRFPKLRGISAKTLNLIVEWDSDSTTSLGEIMNVFRVQNGFCLQGDFDELIINSEEPILTLGEPLSNDHPL